MSLSTLSASLLNLSAPVVAVAPIAPVVAPAPTFKFGPSRELRFEGQLVVDLYAVKGDAGYASAMWAALDEAGIQYWTGGVKVLVKVYGGGKRVNQFAIDNPLSRHKNEPITGWLDRVQMDPLTRAIGVEILAGQLSQAQVKALFKSCGECKYDPAGTAKLVSMFTFIAPPTLPAEVKQFTRTVEHVESVALPVQHVPAGHVEPAPPSVHAEFVGDAPVFPVEPIVADVAVVADELIEIVEVDDLERRTLNELRLICKKEFGFPSPSKITHRRLVFLIEAMRAAS